MEYLILAAALLILFVIYLIRCSLEEKKLWRNLKKSLTENYGKPSTKKYQEGRLKTIAGHFQNKKTEDAIDAITWNDLDLNRVFQSMDFTLSAAGEESLYTMLRCPVFEEDTLKERETLIRYFMLHPDDRVTMQMLFAKIGRTGKYSIYDYIAYLDDVEQGSNRSHYLMLGLMAMAVILCFFNPGYGLLVLCVLLCINMVTYFKQKKEIDPYITTFAYFIRILKVTEEFSAHPIEILKPWMEQIAAGRAKFKKFRRFSSVLMQQNSMSGNPIDVVMDYLRMGLHVNLIKFNTMLREAKKYKQDMIRIIETMGYIEAMISIGAYRSSLPDYTLPEFGQKGLCARKLYHPLIKDPVANSVTLTKGMLLTGSNASGKSTFLKTVALSQILAQTIYTVPADSYQTDFYAVYTSMALRDDLATSSSYFMVEIKSLKRIIDAGKEKKHPVMCFVDEVLRGTNTVERIAASTEILKSLAEDHIFSFAATHDVELTKLLEDAYENYHFEERIENNEISFPYQLCQGRANSRNAIRLLQMLGYEEALIQRAEKRASDFIEQGEWSK